MNEYLRDNEMEVFPQFLKTLYFHKKDVQLGSFFEMICGSSRLLNYIDIRKWNLIKEDINNLIRRSIFDWYNGETRMKENEHFINEMDRESIHLTVMSELASSPIKMKEPFAYFRRFCRLKNEMVFIKSLNTDNETNALIQGSLLDKSKIIDDIKIRSSGLFRIELNQISDFSLKFDDHKSFNMFIGSYFEDKLVKPQIPHFDWNNNNLEEKIRRNSEDILKMSGDPTEENMRKLGQIMVKIIKKSVQDSDGVVKLVMNFSTPMSTVIHCLDLMLNETLNISTRQTLMTCYYRITSVVLNKNVKDLEEVIKSIIGWGSVPEELKFDYNTFIHKLKLCRSPEEVFDVLVIFKGKVGEFILCEKNVVAYTNEKDKETMIEIIEDLNSQLLTKVNIPPLSILSPDAYEININETGDLELTIYEFGWVSNKVWKTMVDQRKWKSNISTLMSVNCHYQGYGGEKKSLLKVQLIVDVVTNEEMRSLPEVRNNVVLSSLVSGISSAFKKLNSLIGLNDDSTILQITANPIFGNYDQPRLRFFEPSETLVSKMKEDLIEDIIEDHKKKGEDLEGAQISDLIFPEPNENSSFSKKGIKEFITDNIKAIQSSRWKIIDKKMKMILKQNIKKSILSEELIYNLLKSGHHMLNPKLFELREAASDDLINERMSKISHFLSHFGDKSQKKIKHVVCAVYQLKFNFKTWVSSNNMYGLCENLKNPEIWWTKAKNVIRKSDCSQCKHLIGHIDNPENVESRDDDLDKTIKSLIKEVESEKKIQNLIKIKVKDHLNGCIFRNFRVDDSGNGFVQCSCCENHRFEQFDEHLNSCTWDLLSRLDGKDWLSQDLEDGLFPRMEEVSDFLCEMYLSPDLSPHSHDSIENKLKHLIMMRFNKNIKHCCLLIKKFSQEDDLPSQSVSKMANDWINNFVKIITDTNPNDPTVHFLKDKFKEMCTTKSGCNDVLVSDLALDILKSKSDTFRISGSNGYLCFNKCFGYIHVDKALLSEESVWFKQLEGLGGYVNHRILRATDALGQMQVSNMTTQDQLNLKINLINSNKNVRLSKPSKSLSFFIKSNNRRMNGMVQNMRYLFMGLNSEIICNGLHKKLELNPIKWSELIMCSELVKYSDDMCSINPQIRLLFESQTKGLKSNKSLMIHQFYKVHFFEKSIPGTYQEIWKIYKKFLKPKLKWESYEYKDDETLMNTKIRSCDGIENDSLRFYEAGLDNLKKDVIETPFFNNQLIANCSKHFSKIKSDRYETEVHHPQPVSDLCKTSSTVEHFTFTRKFSQIVHQIKTRGELSLALKEKGSKEGNKVVNEDDKNSIHNQITKFMISKQWKSFKNDEEMIAGVEEFKILCNNLIDSLRIYYNPLDKDCGNMTEDLTNKFFKVFCHPCFQTGIRSFKLRMRKEEDHSDENLTKIHSKVLSDLGMSDVNQLKDADLKKFMSTVMSEEGLLERKEIIQLSSSGIIPKNLQFHDTMLLYLLRKPKINDYMLFYPFSIEFGMTCSAIKTHLNKIRMRYSNPRAITTDLIVKFISENSDMEYQSTIDCLEVLGLTSDPMVFGMSRKEQYGGERELTIADMIGKFILKILEDIIRNVSKCCVNSCLNSPEREAFHRQLTCAFQKGNLDSVTEWLSNVKPGTSKFLDENIQMEKDSTTNLNSNTKRTISKTYFASEDHAKWGPLHHSLSFRNLFHNMMLPDNIKEVIDFCLMKHQRKHNEIPGLVIERVIKKMLKNGNIIIENGGLNLTKTKLKFEAAVLTDEERYIGNLLMDDKVSTSHRFDMGQGMTHSCSDVYGSFVNDMSNQISSEVMLETFGIMNKGSDMNTSDDSNSILYFSWDKESKRKFETLFGHEDLRDNHFENLVMCLNMNIRDFVQRLFNLHLSPKSTCSTTISEFKSSFVFEGSETRVLIKFISSQLMIGKDFAPHHFWNSYYSLSQQILSNGGNQTLMNLLGCSKFRHMKRAYKSGICNPFHPGVDFRLPPSMGGFPVISAVSAYWGCMSSIIFTSCQETSRVVLDEIDLNHTYFSIEEEEILSQDENDDSYVSQIVFHCKLGPINQNSSFSHEVIIKSDFRPVSYEDKTELIIQWLSCSHLYKDFSDDEGEFFKPLPFNAPRNMSTKMIFKSEASETVMDIKNCILTSYLRKSSEALKVIANQALKSAQKNSFKNAPQSAVFQKAYHMSKGNFFNHNQFYKTDKIKMIHAISKNVTMIRFKYQFVKSFKSLNNRSLALCESCYPPRIQYILMTPRRIDNAFFHESKSMSFNAKVMVNDPLVVLTYMDHIKDISLIPKKMINYSSLAQDSIEFKNFGYPHNPSKLVRFQRSEENKTIEGCYKFNQFMDPMDSIQPIIQNATHPFLNVEVDTIIMRSMWNTSQNFLQDICVLVYLTSSLMKNDDEKRAILSGLIDLESNSHLKKYILTNSSKPNKEGSFLSCLSHYIGMMSLSDHIKSKFKSISNYTTFRIGDQTVHNMLLSGSMYSVSISDNKFIKISSSSPNSSLTQKNLSLMSEILNVDVTNVIISVDESLSMLINSDEFDPDFDMTLTLQDGGFRIVKISSNDNPKETLRKLTLLTQRSRIYVDMLVNDLKGLSLIDNVESPSELFIPSLINIGIEELFSIVHRFKDNFILEELSSARSKPTLNSDSDALEALKKMLTDETLSRSEKRSCFRVLLGTNTVGRRIKLLMNQVLSNDDVQELNLHNTFFNQLRSELKSHRKTGYDNRSLSAMITVMRRTDDISDISRLTFWLSNIIPILNSTNSMPILKMNDFTIVKIKGEFLSDLIKPPRIIKGKKIRKKQETPSEPPKSERNDFYSYFDESTSYKENWSLMQENHAILESTLNEPLRYELVLGPEGNVRDIINYCSSTFNTQIIRKVQFNLLNSNSTSMGELDLNKIEDYQKLQNDFNRTQTDSVMTVSVSLQYWDLSKIIMKM